MKRVLSNGEAAIDRLARMLTQLKLAGIPGRSCPGSPPAPPSAARRERPRALAV